MFKRLGLLSVGLLLATFTLGAGRAEASVVIDLSGVVNGIYVAPVPVFLEAGIYRVDSVGTAEGGFYDSAWLSWPPVMGCDGFGENCERGWENSFLFYSTDASGGAFSGLYSTSAQAFAHPVSTQFAIGFDDTVYFGLGDTGLPDNQGGMSLLITPIPEPATMTLLGTGLIAAARRKRKRA